MAESKTGKDPKGAETSNTVVISRSEEDPQALKIPTCKSKGVSLVWTQRR